MQPSTVNTRAYMPSSGLGADGGWPVEDARSGLAMAVELIVMTAKSSQRSVSMMASASCAGSAGGRSARASSWHLP